LQLQTAKLPGSQVDLTFALDAQDVSRAFDKVFGELAKQGNVPGFRPGKAPAALIRRRYKPEMLRDMAWMRIMEDYVEGELQKEELEVMGDPEFPELEAIELAEGQGVEFTIRVTVRPTPELPDLTALKLHRVIPEVTEEDVAADLQRLQEAAGEEKPVADRDTVEKGDLAEVKLSVALEGEEESSSQGEQTLEVGSGRYQPAIDEQLIGHQVGETVEIPVDYPEDFEDAGLAGRKGTVTAEILVLKQRVLPELDDEFAQSQGEYESLEELQAKTRERLEKAAADNSRKSLENDALGAVVQGATIDMPAALVEQVGRRSFQSFVQDLQKEGLTLEAFKEISGLDEEAMERNERFRAEMGLKVDFVVEAVEKAEAIEATDADIEEELKLFGAENNLDEDFLHSALDLQEGFRDQLQQRAVRRLTVQRIIEQAQVEDVTAEQYREIKQAEREAREAEAAAKAAEAEASEESPAEVEADSDEAVAEETPEVVAEAADEAQEDETSASE
jgi:trigger factor